MGEMQVIQLCAAWHPCKYPVESNNAKMARCTYKCFDQEHLCMASLALVKQELPKHLDHFRGAMIPTQPDNVNRHFGT